MSNIDDREHVSNLQSELKSILDEKFSEQVKGTQIRSRAKWIIESDNNPIVFKYLEKKHQTNNRISCLENDNGLLHSDTNNLLEITTFYYKNLFTSKNIPDKEINTYLNNINLQNTLSQEDASICEKDLTENECYVAVTQMKTNKSPCYDGLPVEFYPTYWAYIDTP